MRVRRGFSTDLEAAIPHNYEFFIERAEACAAEAEVAELENVRNRALRSEATWRDLAKVAKAVARERRS